MNRCSSILMACALAGVFGWNTRSEAQTPTISDLPKSSRCSTSAPLIYADGATMQTTMRVSSSGGCCWLDLWATMGSITYVGTYLITSPPTHGEIQMGEVNRKARIAYKPEAGFIGNDSFVIVNKMTHSERPVAVTIVR